MRIISFGKQIPIMKCKVQDNQTKKFVPATVYNVDCNNFSDYETVKKAKGEWIFKDYILSNMRTKMLINNIPGFKTTDEFYLLKTALDNNVIGMVQTCNKDDGINIKYIEAKSGEKYKYAGQNMLASLAKKLQKENGGALIVNAPVMSAIPFYISKCGFRYKENGKLILQSDESAEFIKRTEEITQTNLIDLQG